MDITQLVFEILLYVLIFYSLLCVLFLLVISKFQYKVYKQTVSEMIQPSMVKSLKEDDSNGEFMMIGKTFSKKLNELSNAYATPDREFSNRNIHVALTCFGIILVLFILIPGYLLYKKQIVLPYRRMLKEAILFFGMLIGFGIYFFTRVVSRYVPIIPSELFQYIIDGATRLNK